MCDFTVLVATAVALQNEEQKQLINQTTVFVRE